MTNLWGWIGQYAAIVVLIPFAGRILGRMEFSHAFALPSLGLGGSQAIRLIADGTGLAAFCVLSVSIARRMDDDGRGAGFLRGILLPATTLAVLILAHRSLHGAGTPLLERLGHPLYPWGYAAALLAAGLWLSAAWIGRFTSLRACFTPPHGPTAVESSPTAGSDPAVPRQADGPTVAAVNGGAPSSLGRYKILKELGRGAMGIVYLGKDPTIQRFVAIKTMSLGSGEGDDKAEEARVRFFREAESTGRLSHPNIVTVYDAGEEHELGYIAMELLDGTSLKTWSRRPKLMPAKEVIAVLATVADALDYAHQQGVVHRDVKPANIMVTKDGIVKVTDFGIAKMASSSKTQTNVVLGTPSYMSPEQIAGKRVDGRSDIFSLGVVLYELLTGHPPFVGDNLPALLFAVSHHPPAPIHTLCPNLPPSLVEILDQAMQKEPLRRYRRAGELAEALRTCLRSPAFA